MLEARKSSKYNWYLIRTVDQLEEYLSGYDKSLIFTDTETDSLSIFSTLFGISMFNIQKFPAFIVADSKYFDGIPLSVLRNKLDPIFIEGNHVGHNIKFDLGIFKSNGFADPKVIFDTLIAIHIYDPDLRKNLEYRMWEDFKWRKLKFEEIMSKPFKKITWTEENVLEKLAEYSCGDVYGTRLIYDKYKPLIEEMGCSHLMTEVEVPLSYVLRDMKQVGVKIDVAYLKSLDVRLDEKLNEVEGEIYEKAGCVFNINSSKQKAEVLYDKLGFECSRFTKKDGRSTDAKALADLAEEGCEPAVAMIEYSGLNKLSTGYVKSIPLLVDHDGRLRGDFNSTGAKTGRFSSSEPNLQNVPIKGKAKEFPIRDAYIPEVGYKLLCADWSQIEYRLLAHVSGDEKLIKAFQDGYDFHAFVSKSLNISRSHAKVVNFGIIYGMMEKSLGLNLGIPKQEARKIIDNYYRTYRGVELWKHKVEASMYKLGYVKNIFGRIVKYPAAMDRSHNYEYQEALRQGINCVIQGSAADLMKKCLVQINTAIFEKMLDAKLMLTVHDEVLLEVKECVPGRYYHLEETRDTVKNVMENHIKLRIPILAEIKCCDKWGDMKDDDYVCLLKRPKFLSNPVDLITYGLL